MKNLDRDHEIQGTPPPLIPLLLASHIDTPYTERMEDTQVNQSTTDLPDFLSAMTSTNSKPRLNVPDLDLEMPLKQIAPVPPKGPKVLTNVHRAMVDTILARPDITMAELGDHYGISQSWTNMIVNSVAFKRQLEKRRDEVINPIIIASTEERLQAVVNRSLDVIHEKLNKSADQVSDTLALRALELSSKAMGMGQVKAATVVIESNHLDNLAKRLVALRPRTTSQGEVYEADAKEIHGSRGD